MRWHFAKCLDNFTSNQIGSYWRLNGTVVKLIIARNTYHIADEGVQNLKFKCITVVMKMMMYCRYLSIL